MLRATGTNIQHRRGYPIDVHAAPALPALDPRHPKHEGQHLLHTRQATQGFGVVDGELVRGSPKHTGDSNCLGFPRVDGQDIGSELAELTEYVATRTFADGGEKNHRGDADGDAEHGKHRT